MDIFDRLDRIETMYRRRVNKYARAAFRPVLVLVGFVVLTVLVLIAAVPALIYLKMIDE